MAHHYFEVSTKVALRWRFVVPAMSNPNVFDIREYFEPAEVGKALAKLWAINSLSFELVPALDDEGNHIECPLTLAAVKNPAMTQDGCIYQMGAILEWIQDHKLSSPLTGLPLPHSRVMLTLF